MSSPAPGSGDFARVRDKVFASHGRGQYQAGLAAIDSYDPQNEDERVDLAFWEMCLLSRLGMPDEVCSLFRSSLNEGWWWGPAMLADPDFDSVRAIPEWRRLALESEERCAAAKTDDREPIQLGRVDGPAIPLVLLHGAAQRPEVMIERFGIALEYGLRLVAPYGDEPMATSRFGWSARSGDQAVIRQVQGLVGQDSVLIIGYSQGAGLAGYLAWSGRLPTAGVGLLAPSFSIRGMPIPCPGVHAVPTGIWAGSDDRALEDAKQVARVLQTCDVPVRLEIEPGRGHEMPDDLKRVVTSVLKLVEEDTV